MAGNQNIVGDKVRSLRVSHDWNQETLAANCQLQGWDVSRGTLSKVEAKLRRVTDSEVYILAKVLNVEIDELYPSAKEVKESLRNP